MNNNRPDEFVTTWANFAGVWHAKINFPYPGYGPQFLEEHGNAIRAKARRAIRKEILSRQSVSSRWECRIEVSENDLDSLNRMHSLTYREMTDG